MIPKARRVPKMVFMEKLQDINREDRRELERFILFNQGMIHHFEYGHIHKHRVYKIVLKDGAIRSWNFERS